MAFIRLCKDMGIRKVYLMNYLLTICTVPYLPIYLKVFAGGATTRPVGVSTSEAMCGEGAFFKKHPLREK